MTLYTFVVEVQGMGGDTCCDIAGIFDSEEKAQTEVVKFNNLGLSRNHEMGYPVAKLGTPLELNKCDLNYDELEKLNEK